MTDNVRVSWTVESNTGDLFVDVLNSVKLGTPTTTCHGLTALVADSGEVLGPAEVGALKVLPTETVNDDAGTVTAAPLTIEQSKTVDAARVAGYTIADAWRRGDE